MKCLSMPRRSEKDTPGDNGPHLGVQLVVDNCKRHTVVLHRSSSIRTITWKGAKDDEGIWRSYMFHRLVSRPLNAVRGPCRVENRD